MSRVFFFMSCFALLSSPALAADKPNALTPKEIAEGWIMLFDGETTFGWKIDGAATVKDGVLILGKGKKTLVCQSTLFGDFQAKAEIDGAASIYFASQRVAIEPLNGIKQDGFWPSVSFEKESGTAYQVNGISAKSEFSKKHEKALTQSSFIIETDGKGEVQIRNIKLRPLNTKPLFNGKDLSGWKVTQSDPKRVATRFTVTPDGELSAKNGPGDLQTEKQFDDFVLQLECKTNGKALNSGLFFRCMPDAYQNGYEAQIQNAYIGDRTKPIDYGTGAIYRRVKARKVVSNDNEWFTMTVAARGPHIATWVNGYQTVDWTDDRKASDNPRQGLRTAKGHLSIQGHDPTTDLLFRNIRIAELPK
jgi:hypothetical protein